MILGRVNIIGTPLALMRLTLSFGRSLRTFHLTSLLQSQSTSIAQDASFRLEHFSTLFIIFLPSKFTERAKSFLARPC